MERIKHLFNEKQIQTFKDAGIELEDKNYSNQEIIDMEDTISDYFQDYGIDENDEINEKGNICESIMDIFASL